MRTGILLKVVAVLAIVAIALPAWSVPVAVDTTSPSNGITDWFSATFDGALSPCTPSDPSWCSFFNGKPGPSRSIVITPTPTGVVNAAPLGITPVPASGSYLDLAVNGAQTQVTISGGTIAVPAISLTIQGGTPNATVVNASGAGVVFSSTPQTAALDANGRAEFLVNLAPALAVDFSTFSIITAPPAGSCAGPLCAIIPILTLDMVRYRLVIDYDPTFTTFTADFIGQTGNNSLVSLTLNSVASENPGAPVRVRLDAHNQRSSGGTLSTLKWKTCSPTGATNPCYSTTNAWTLANATGSDAVWTWDAATGVLAMTGTFQTTSFVSSNANGSPVISDKVVNMTINTTNNTTTATSYQCVEGTFLSSVGANGCLNVSTGDDFVTNSSAVYNVGGDALCVQRTVGGDDVSTGNTRGVTSVAAAPPCDATDGAFDLWDIELDNTATGGQLIIRNATPIANPGTNFLTFTAAADAADDGPFNALQSVPVELDVLANDNNFTDPVTVTVTTAPTQGTATVLGTSPGAQAGITIQYTANPAATGADSFVYTVLSADGVTSDTATVTINVLAGTDTVPDSFAFVDKTGVALASPSTSDPISITGITTPVPISVSGDPSSQYSINSGAFTSVAGTVTNGSSVRVRHTSSAAPGTAVDTVLDVGGVTDTFTSTTLQYAIDDFSSTTMNQPVQIDVLQNDNGLLSTVFVGVWIDPIFGVASVSGAPGSPSGIRVTYTPNPGFSGPDSFEYWVESGLVVDYGLVNVEVINPDTDGDGVLNTLDNCSLVVNPTQCDSDNDGYGNHCDGDLTNNGFTNSQDTVVFRTQLAKASNAPTYNAADLNCNGFVNAQDSALFRQLLGKPPGPSGPVP